MEKSSRPLRLINATANCLTTGFIQIAPRGAIQGPNFGQTLRFHCAAINSGSTVTVSHLFRRAAGRFCIPRTFLIRRILSSHFATHCAFPNHLYPFTASVFPCPRIVGDDTAHSVSPPRLFIIQSPYSRPRFHDYATPSSHG